MVCSFAQTLLHVDSTSPTLTGLSSMILLKYQTTFLFFGGGRGYTKNSNYCSFSRTPAILFIDAVELLALARRAALSRSCCRPRKLILVHENVWSLFFLLFVELEFMKLRKVPMTPYTKVAGVDAELVERVNTQIKNAAKKDREVMEKVFFVFCFHSFNPM